MKGANYFVKPVKEREIIEMEVIVDVIEPMNKNWNILITTMVFVETILAEVYIMKATTFIVSTTFSGV